MSEIVVLTGATGGLGRAMAQGLAADGHRLVLVDRDAAALAELSDLLGGSGFPLAWDLSAAETAEALATEAARPFGPPAVLVNNAGLGLNYVRNDFVQKPIDFWEVSPAVVRQFFAVNGAMPYLLAALLVPSMLARRFGRIVNVTTSLDSMIRRGFAPYGGTKASLEAHTAIMAADLEGTGITANVLVPGGPADTPMIPAETGYSRDRMVAPAAMVPPLRWLVSPDGSGVSGRRVLAALWRSNDPAASLQHASAPAAWPQLGAQTVWPT